MQPWTREEEVKIVELLRSGMSIDNIAMKSSIRTKEEIDKKIKQIIYENVIGGKNITQVAKLLKLPEEQVKLYFDSYHSYIKTKELKKEAPVNIGEKIEILERENRFIKSILENRILKKKLNELIRDGLISENIKTVISNLRNNKL